MEEENLALHYGQIRDRIRTYFPGASADDVVQEAYREALSYVKAPGREIQSPAGLLWTIAMRKAIRVGFESRGPPGTNYDLRSFLGRELGPWKEAAVKEMGSRVRETVARLPPASREVVYRFYFEDESCKEIAERLGIGRSLVRSRLHRARKTLRWMLSAEDPR